MASWVPVIGHGEGSVAPVSGHVFGGVGPEFLQVGLRLEIEHCVGGRRWWCGSGGGVGDGGRKCSISYLFVVSFVSAFAHCCTLSIISIHAVQSIFKYFISE